MLSINEVRSRVETIYTEKLRNGRASAHAKLIILSQCSTLKYLLNTNIIAEQAILKLLIARL